MRPVPAESARVTLAWGDYVLFSRLLRRGEQLAMGSDATSDFVVPEEVLGQGEAVRVRVAPSGRVRVTTPVSESLVEPRTSLALTLGALELSVSALDDAPARRPFFSPGHIARDLGVALAVLCHAPLLLAASVVWADKLGPDTEIDEIDRASEPWAGVAVSTATGAGLHVELADELWLARSEPPTAETAAGTMIFPEARAKERAVAPPVQGRHVTRANADERSGGTGARAKASEGAIGNPHAPDAHYAWGILQRRDHPRVHLANARHPSGVARWGINISTFTEPPGWGWDDDGAIDTAQEPLTAPWGEDDDDGEDPNGAVGNMYGPEPEDPRGDGLGLSGKGPGGGGRAKSIGIGVFGTPGHGAGPGHEQGVGILGATLFERDSALGAHQTRAPSMVTRIAPDVVERVLRNHAGRLHSCFRETPPSGAAAIRFTVSPDGSARDVAIDDVTGSAARVCVANVVGGLRFLPAATTAVSVSYRLPLR